MDKETKKCPYCGEEILAIAKKCKYCGEWLTEEKAEDTLKQMIPCPICSEMIEEGTEICPHCHEKLTKPSKLTPAITKTIKTEKEDDGTRSFFDYYLWDPFFRHYFDFKGRLNRKHYWLSIMVWLGVCLSLIVMLPPIGACIFIVFFIASIIPLYATAARRMRDGDSIPGISGWISLFFPTVLWWLVKPTEYRAEGMEDAEPDTPQPVKFKKVDKIICCVYALLFAIGIPLFISLFSDSNDNKKENEIELITEDTSEEDVAFSDTDEDETPNGVLSATNALKLYDLIGISNKAEHLLVENGYEYVGEVLETEYWAKDCKLGRGKNGYEIVEPSSESSCIQLSKTGLSITAYDESVFKSWYSQLRELGYIIENNQGNQGQDWNAEKEGAVPITIWNDYGNCYSLIIMNTNY